MGRHQLRPRDVWNQRASAVGFADLAIIGRDKTVVRRIWPVLAALCVFALASVPDAVFAHAILLRVDPPATRTLDSPPTVVHLLFSEPIDGKFSEAQVFDPSGVQVDLRDSRVDDTQLSVSLPAGLPNGVYSVVWRSLSSIDVHPEIGEYQLFVGVPVGSATAAATQRSESTPPTLISRWWLYVAASIFTGALAAWKLVFGPIMDDKEAREAALRRLRRLAVMAGVLLLVGTLFAAVAQAAAAAAVPLEGAFGAPLRDLLTRGRYAGIWWPRLGISIVAVGIVAWRGLDDAWSESAAAMMPAVLLTNSLTSHGATLPSVVFGVVLDWVHVLAAAVWVGGLASLAVIAPCLRQQRGLTLRAVRRFTWVAVASVVAIILSGTLQAVFEVGSLDALLTTTYGQGVLIKVALLLAMLVVAAAVRLRGAFERGVRIELALGVIVLAVAAVVAGTTPARQTTTSPDTAAQAAPYAP